MSGSSTSPADGANVRVDVDNRQQAHELDHIHLSELLASALAAQHLAAEAEVGLAFIDVAEMTELNRTHMGAEGPTDVLAFPIDGVAGGAPVPAGQPMMFGDIVICPEVAARAPQEFGDELALLVVHGALHLVGHDHVDPDETAAMKALETELLDRFHRS